MKKSIDTKVAARALSDLNMFAAIVTLPEGHIYSQSGRRVGERIISLCKTEQQRQLRTYDRARGHTSAD
jgi:hypothetical protein